MAANKSVIDNLQKAAVKLLDNLLKQLYVTAKTWCQGNFFD